MTQQVRQKEEIMITIPSAAPQEYHLMPLDTISGFEVRPGLYEIYGATALSANAVNFTVHSRNATHCELLLFRKEEKEPFAVLPFPENYHIGDVYSMIVFHLNVKDFEYAYRLDGPYEPENGLLFDRTKVLLDPYAKAVTGQHIWGQSPDEQSPYRARVVLNNFDWGTADPPLLPMQDLIIYEMHVRGFTMHPSSGVKHPGTFDGLREKIPYLKELGVTAVELMPIFEFDETMGSREVDGKKLLDYWGYNSVSFFAPNTSYASEEEYNHEGYELKSLVKELNENGIEVFLDVVFNHTAEGNEQGPYFCFKGFDNNVYYMLTPDGQYYNFSGCGNTLNCNHPIVRQMILECLRYWVTTFRINGFRFDLASILGRDKNGLPSQNAPLLESLAFDPVLADVKLIAEAWDAGGLYQVGSFPAWNRWAEWNGRYRDDLRSFLKGDYWTAPAVAQRISGSMDLYTGQYRGYNSSINFITCHDGFSLYDLYSYNEKHNLANGWDNTDGANDNRSWNCGAEGETDDPQINALRMRLMKNAVSVLMCSRGTPMFLAGDEFGDTRFGNNNPYCQDNEISWLDWSLLDKNRELFEHCKFMIQFRKKHCCIRGGGLPSSTNYPMVSTHGNRPGAALTEESKVVCVFYTSQKEHSAKDDLVYMAINSYWEDQQIWLPALPKPYTWKMAVYTDSLDPRSLSENTLVMGPRTVAIFEAVEY